MADRLEPYAEKDGVDPLASSIAYPPESEFGTRLRYLAAMIEKPLGIRVADVEADGDLDTHDDQAELGDLLAAVSETSPPSRPTSRRVAWRMGRSPSSGRSSDRARGEDQEDISR